MFASIGAWFAKKMIFAKLGSGLKAAGSGIARFFRSLDIQGWIGLILVVILGVLLIHEWGEARTYKKQSARFEQLYRQSQADAKALEQKALAIKARADQINTKISTLERTHSDAEIRRIYSSRDALRVHGPGAASCQRVSDPGMAVSSSGHDAGHGTGSPAPARMPAEDRLTAVQWDWLVDTGAQCDANRSEALSWRSWYEKIAKSWPGGTGTAGGDHK